MSIDSTVFLFASQLHTPLTQEVALSLTALGSLPVILVYIITLYLTGRKRSSLMLMLGAGIAGGLSYLIKHSIARPRPDGAVIETLTPAFPSGHTTLAFLTAIILGKHFPEEKVWFLGIAAVVGITRLLLMVHYLTDVIAGALIGILIGELLLRCEDRILTRIPGTTTVTS